LRFDGPSQKGRPRRGPRGSTPQPRLALELQGLLQRRREALGIPAERLRARVQPHAARLGLLALLVFIIII